MKKLLCVLVAALLLISCLIVPASAAANYCDLFSSEIDAVWLASPSNVKETEEFSPSVIKFYALLTMDLGDYQVEGGDEYDEYYSVPADKFEAYVKKHFNIADVSVLKNSDDCSSFNADKNTYELHLGGLGGAMVFSIHGYAENGNNKYTVYGYTADLAYDLTDDAVLGKDYIIFDTHPAQIIKVHKITLEYKNSNVKFLSWQDISLNDIPSGSTLVLPKAKQDETDVSSDTSTNSSSEIDASSEESSSSDISSEAEVSSEEEEKEETKLNVIAKTESVSVLAADDAFPEDTVVSIEKLSDGATFDTVTDSLSELADKFVAFNITAMCDDKIVQPSSEVQVLFTIPSDFNAEKIEVYHISENGEYTYIPSTITDDGKIKVTLKHFSVYALAETNEGGNSLLVGIIIAIIVVLLLAAAGIVVFIIIYKKNKTKVYKG